MVLDWLNMKGHKNLLVTHLLIDAGCIILTQVVNALVYRQLTVITLPPWVTETQVFVDAIKAQAMVATLWWCPLNLRTVINV